MKFTFWKTATQATTQTKQIEAPLAASTQLTVRVGGQYPIMFGYSPTIATVTKLVPFGGTVEVAYTRSGGGGWTEPLEIFVREIARRYAHDHNSVISVEVPEEWITKHLS